MANNKLDLARAKLQLKGVQYAKEQNELRVLEKLEDIERLKEDIKISVEKEKELEDKIKELSKE